MKTFYFYLTFKKKKIKYKISKLVKIRKIDKGNYFGLYEK